MLSDYYYIDLCLTGYGWICVVFLFMLCSFLAVQFAPIIKKYLTKAFDIIVKRDKHRIDF